MPVDRLEETRVPFTLTHPRVRWVVDLARGALVALVALAIAVVGVGVGALSSAVARAEDEPEVEAPAVKPEASPSPGKTEGLQTTRLDPVVVTATRTRELLSNTPQTVTVITREEIAEREDATIPDVLRQ